MSIKLDTFRYAVTTRYAGPTNYRGSRIIARTNSMRVTMPYRHELNASGNHAAAAQLLADKMGWSGEWRGAQLPDDSGYVFIYNVE